MKTASRLTLGKRLHHGAQRCTLPRPRSTRRHPLPAVWRHPPKRNKTNEEEEPNATWLLLDKDARERLRADVSTRTCARVGCPRLASLYAHRGPCLATTHRRGRARDAALPVVTSSSPLPALQQPAYQAHESWHRERASDASVCLCAGPPGVILTHGIALVLVPAEAWRRRWRGRRMICRGTPKSASRPSAKRSATHGQQGSSQQDRTRRTALTRDASTPLWGWETA